MSRPYVSVSDQRLIVERAQGRCEYWLSPAEYATRSIDIDDVCLSATAASPFNSLALALWLQQSQVSRISALTQLTA